MPIVAAEVGGEGTGTWVWLSTLAAGNPIGAAVLLGVLGVGLAVTGIWAWHTLKGASPKQVDAQYDIVNNPLPDNPQPFKDAMSEKADQERQNPASSSTTPTASPNPGVPPTSQVSPHVTLRKANGPSVTDGGIFGTWTADDSCGFGDAVVMKLFRDNSGDIAGTISAKNIVEAADSQSCEQAQWDGTVDRSNIVNARLAAGSFAFSTIFGGEATNVVMSIQGNTLVWALPSNTLADGVVSPGSRYVFVRAD
jgi:hypothetical protein